MLVMDVFKDNPGMGGLFLSSVLSAALRLKVRYIKINSNTHIQQDRCIGFKDVDAVEVERVTLKWI